MVQIIFIDYMILPGNLKEGYFFFQVINKLEFIKLIILKYYSVVQCVKEIFAQK